MWRNEFEFGIGNGKWESELSAYKSRRETIYQDVRLKVQSDNECSTGNRWVCMLISPNNMCHRARGREGCRLGFHSNCGNYETTWTVCATYTRIGCQLSASTWWTTTKVIIQQSIEGTHRRTHTHIHKLTHTYTLPHLFIIFLDSLVLSTGCQATITRGLCMLHATLTRCHADPRSLYSLLCLPLCCLCWLCWWVFGSSLCHINSPILQCGQ